MDRSQLQKDFHHIKLVLLGMLMVLILAIGYNTIYSNVARRDCYQKARQAMGLVQGQSIVLGGNNGNQVATAYSGYYSMCLSKEHGLAQ
jgi:hypothetical protein